MILSMLLALVFRLGTKNVQAETTVARYMTCIGENSCQKEWTCEADVSSWKELDNLSLETSIDDLRRIQAAEEFCGPDGVREEIIQHLTDHLLDEWEKAKKRNFA